jgi:DNA-binding transcriptional ArsR family regulator
LTSGERALDHPLRATILDLYNEDVSRSLAALDLLHDLPDDDLSVSGVTYHVRILKDAELLPS